MSIDKLIDTWIKCALCLQDFSSDCRPTTLDCGHSVCIAHMLTKSPLMTCPICGCGLKSQGVSHVSFALEEAVRVFNLIKTTQQLTVVHKRNDKNIRRKYIPPVDEQYEEALNEVEKRLDEMEFSSKGKTKKRAK